MATPKRELSHLVACSLYVVNAESRFAYGRTDGIFGKFSHPSTKFRMTSKTAVASILRRGVSTAAQSTRPAGDISSVFPSLSGKKADPLPQRFSDLKLHYLRQCQDVIQKSWLRLLPSLRDEVEEVKARGTSVRNIVKSTPCLH